MAQKAPIINPIQGPGYALGGENRLHATINTHLETDPGGSPDLRGAYTLIAPGFGRAGPSADGFFNLWIYWVLKTITVYYEDAADFDADTFGSLAGLTNGVQLTVRDDGGDVVLDLIDLIGNEKIQTNGEWLRYYGSDAVQIANFGGGASNYLSVQIDLEKFFGLNVVLNPGWYVEFKMEDDLTGLDDLSVVLQGRSIFAPKGGGSFQPLG